MFSNFVVTHVNFYRSNFDVEVKSAFKSGAMFLDVPKHQPDPSIITAMIYFFEAPNTVN